MLTRKTVLAAASFVTITVLSTGCSFSASLGNQVKKEDVETRLTQEISAQTGKPAKISCPKDLPGKEGASIECNADIAGQSYPVAVTVNTVQGSKVNYSFESKGKPAADPTPTPSGRPSASPSSSPSSGKSPTAVPSGARVPKIGIEVKVADGIKEQTGKATVVDCPRDLEAKVGDTMTCTASLVGEKRQVEVTAKAIEGDQVNYSYRLL